MIPAHVIPPDLRPIGSRFMMAFLSGAGDIKILPVGEAAAADDPMRSAER